MLSKSLLKVLLSLCQQLYLHFGPRPKNITLNVAVKNRMLQENNMPWLDSSVNLFCTTSFITNAQVMAVHTVLPNLLVMSIAYPSAHS